MGNLLVREGRQSSRVGGLNNTLGYQLDNDTLHIGRLNVCFSFVIGGEMTPPCRRLCNVNRVKLGLRLNFAQRAAMEIIWRGKLIHV